MKKNYRSARKHVFNITQIGDLFGLHRDTVRAVLNARQVKAVDNVAGRNVYILRDAAEAIVMHEYEKDQRRNNKY